VRTRVSKTLVKLAACVLALVLTVPDPFALGLIVVSVIVRRQLVFPLATIVFPRVGWLGERPAKPLRGFARTLSCSLGLVA
jgi:hypothetical protein